MCALLQNIKEALNELALNVGIASNEEVIEKLNQIAQQIQAFQDVNC